MKDSQKNEIIKKNIQILYKKFKNDKQKEQIKTKWLSTLSEQDEKLIIKTLCKSCSNNNKNFESLDIIFKKKLIVFKINQQTYKIKYKKWSKNKPNEKIYIGEIKRSFFGLKQQRHGIGIYILNSKEIVKYSGKFKHNQFNGYGTAIYKTDPSTQQILSYYEGEFLNNQRHGLGIMTTKNIDNNTPSTCYDGEWKHNKKHGKATIIYNNGVKETGQFINDLKEGKWIKTVSLSQGNQDRYQITYKNNQEIENIKIIRN